MQLAYHTVAKGHNYSQWLCRAVRQPSDPVADKKLKCQCWQTVPIWRSVSVINNMDPISFPVVKKGKTKSLHKESQSVVYIWVNNFREYLIVPVPSSRTKIDGDF